MASENLTGTLNLASTNGVPFLLASQESLQTNGKFDMPTSFSLDFNLTSSNAVGTLDIILQNDDPSVSTFLTTPKLSFPISGGTFASNQTKQTIDSNGATFTKYLYAKYTSTSGTGTIAITGQISFKG